MLRDVICGAFVDYSSVDEYAVFQNSVDARRILSLVPKRGNVRYASGVKKRFNELIIPFEVEPAKDVLLVDGKTNCLSLTLTYDTSFVISKRLGSMLALSLTVLLLALRSALGVS